MLRYRTPQAFIMQTIANTETKVPVTDIISVVGSGETMQAVVRTHNRNTVRSLKNIMVEV